MSLRYLDELKRLPGVVHADIKATDCNSCMSKGLNLILGDNHTIVMAFWE